MLSVWTAIGFIGQALFSMRFLIQLDSQRAYQAQHRAGGVLVFQRRRRHHAAGLRDIPGRSRLHPGAGPGFAIYARNIWLIWRNKQEKADTVPDVGRIGIVSGIVSAVTTDTARPAIAWPKRAGSRFGPGRPVSHALPARLLQPAADRTGMKPASRKRPARCWRAAISSISASRMKRATRSRSASTGCSRPR